MTEPVAESVIEVYTGNVCCVRPGEMERFIGYDKPFSRALVDVIEFLSSRGSAKVFTNNLDTVYSFYIIWYLSRYKEMDKDVIDEVFSDPETHDMVVGALSHKIVFKAFDDSCTVVEVSPESAVGFVSLMGHRDVEEIKKIQQIIEGLVE